MTIGQTIRRYTAVLLALGGIGSMAVQGGPIPSLTAAQSFGFQAQGGADLKTGTAPDGSTSLRAEGNGKRDYGGLRLPRSLDLSQAGPDDYLEFDIKQNVDNGFYVFLKNSRGIAFTKSFPVAKDRWTTVRVPLRQELWRLSPDREKSPAWGNIEILAWFHQALDKPGEYVEIGNPRLMIGNRDLLTLAPAPEVAADGRALTDTPQSMILKTDAAIWQIDRQRGAIAGAWRQRDGRNILAGTRTVYHWQSRSGDRHAGEEDDRVSAVRSLPGGGVEFTATNPGLPDVTIVKKFFREDNRLVRQLEFVNHSPEKGYLTPVTETVFSPEFRQDAYYFGGAFVGPLLPASSLRTRERVTRFSNSAKCMVLSNDSAEGSLANYRRKLDGRFLFPWWAGALGNYVEYPNMLYYTPRGWELAYGTVDLAPQGGRNSSEDVWEFFHGTWFDFLGEGYARDPEAKRALDAIPPPPQWLGDVYAVNFFYREGVAGLKQLLEMSAEGDILVLFDLSCNWGDYRVEQNGLDGYWGGHITPEELKEHIAKLKALSPRIKVAVYQFMSSAIATTPLFKEHPEWFRKHDREGNDAILFPGCPLNFAFMVNRPEVRRAMAQQFRALKEYLGTDYIYLDETKAINQIDWDSGELLREADWFDFWQELRQLRKDHPETAFFFNGRANPYGDINFIEAGEQLAPERWRDFAGMGFASELFLNNRPGARISLLYWSGKNDYFNRVLALGMIPQTEVDRPIQRVIPQLNMLYEMGPLKPVALRYSPDWKCDAETAVESYAMSRKPGDELVLSLINRNPASDRVAVEIDLARFAGKPVMIYSYAVEADRAPREPLGKEEDRQYYRANAWRGNLLAAPELLYRGPAPTGFRHTLSIPPHHMAQLVVVPGQAAVFSDHDLPCNYFFGKTRKIAIQGDEFPLEVTSNSEKAEIVLPFAAQVKVNGEPAPGRLLRIGRKLHTVIGVPQGKSTITAEPAAEPTVASAPLAAHYADQRIEASGAQAYNLTLNGKTIYAGPAPIAVPPVRSAGDYRLAALDNPDNAVTVPIPEGRKSSGWSITHGPRRAPTLTATPVERVLGDGKILGAATATSDSARIWTIQPELDPFVVKADPDRLTLTAGTSRKIEDYWGAAFAGFELDRIRKLEIELSNSFYAAVTREERNRHVTGWRRSPREFAGFTVDYHTPRGYSRRVAFSVGVRHAQCNTVNPDYGKKGRPDEFVDLGNFLDSPQHNLLLDLEAHAPADWDGRVWFSVGTDWVAPDRRLSARILAVNDACRKPSDAELKQVQLEKEARTRREVEARPLAAPPRGFDDPIWGRPPEAMRFFRLATSEPARQQSQGRIAWDAENIYVVMRCTETLRGKPLTGGSQIWENDDAELFLIPPDGTVWQILNDASGKLAVFCNNAPVAADGIQARVRGVPDEFWEVLWTVPFQTLHAAPEGKWEFNLCRTRQPGNGLPLENSTFASLHHRYYAQGEVAELTFTPADWMLKNFGVPGANSADAVASILPRVLEFKPDVAIVLIGTNDALNSDKLAAPEEYERNLRRIFTALRRDNIVIIPVKLPPCSETLLLRRHPRERYGTLGPAERLQSANAVIDRLSREFGLEPVAFDRLVAASGSPDDHASLLRNPANSKSEDGVHPTAEGYRRLSLMLAEAVRETGKTRGRIACIGDSITYGAHMRGAGTVAGDTYPAQLYRILNQPNH